MKPLKDNVIVSRADKETKSEGGILLVDNKQTNDAVVKFVGPEASGVSEGDKVLLNPKGQVTQFHHRGEEFYAVPIKDIMAVYPKHG